MMEATEGLSEGPVSSRPASLGLLLVSLTNVNNQLSRSQTGLADYKDRLSSLQTLPVTELVRLAEVNPTEKLPTVLVRRMAQDKVTSTISSMSSILSNCMAMHLRNETVKMVTTKVNKTRTKHPTCGVLQIAAYAK